MGSYRTEEILGVLNKRGEVVCTDCLGDTPWYDAVKTEDDVITQNRVKSKKEIFFCDRCKKRL